MAMLNPISSMTARAVFKLFSLMFIATVIFGCTTQKTKDEAQLHARIGTALLQQGHYPDALRELLAAEKLDSSDASIQNNLGLAFFMREKYKTATEHLQKALSITPSYSEARNNLGRVLIEMGRYDYAVRELEKVISDLTYPDPAKAYVNLGLAYFRQAEYPQAKVNFSKAIQLSRENCLAQTYYGRSLFELSNFDLAAQALDNAAVVCRAGSGASVDEAQYYGGLAYYKLGKTSSAISRMEEVVKLNPDGRFAKKAENLLKLMK